MVDPMADTKPLLADTSIPVYDSCSETSSISGTVICITPEQEAAARSKFDKYLVPVSLVFIILSALDRNNVSPITYLLRLSLTVG
jgi:hypothetical protein